MGVDQVSKHGHSSDADGGEDISPASVSTEEETITDGTVERVKTVEASMSLAGDSSKMISNLPTHDYYEFEFHRIGCDSGSSDIRMEVNGDAGQNYEWTDFRGSTTANSTDENQAGWQIINVPTNEASGTITVTGDSSGGLYMASQLTLDKTAAAQGENTNVTGPLASVTLRGNNTTITGDVVAVGVDVTVP